MHETVFHVLSQFGYQVNAVYEELLKERLGNISLISNKLPIDLGQQVGAGKRIPIVYITGSEDKIQDLFLINDDEMHLQSKEPTNAAMSFGCMSPEDFVRVLTFDMTGSDGSKVDKGYAGTSAQVLCLKGNYQR